MAAETRILQITNGYFIELGSILCEQKTKLGHGKFMDWVAERLKISQKTAENFMKKSKWVNDHLNLFPVINGKIVIPTNLNQATYEEFIGVEDADDDIKSILREAADGTKFSRRTVQQRLGKVGPEKVKPSTRSPESEIRVDSHGGSFDSELSVEPVSTVNAIEDENVDAHTTSSGKWSRIASRMIAHLSPEDRQFARKHINQILGVVRKALEYQV